MHNCLINGISSIIKSLRWNLDEELSNRSTIKTGRNKCPNEINWNLSTILGGKKNAKCIISYFNGTDSFKTIQYVQTDIKENKISYEPTLENVKKYERIL